MANPLIDQGTLNKLRAAVLVIDLPQLNVTQGFLGRDQVGLRFDGPASGFPATQTGAVPSPNPYQMTTITVHALRTQALAAAWKAQVELSTTLGPLSVIPDAATLPDYDFTSCVIDNIEGLDFNGAEPDFTITIKGVYNINNALFG